MRARTRLLSPAIELIRPDWPAPPGVRALVTTRAGGFSDAPYHSLNLGAHVGDRHEAVAANRAALTARLPAGTDIQWLSQEHGTAVVEAGRAGQPPSADASWTGRPGVACAVLTADCLPVLFCARSGDLVAAAHAGWRGLQAGVLEATVAATGRPPAQLMAWLGPAIGRAAFEVGPEVRSAFLERAGDSAQRAATAACFLASPDRPGHYLADLCGLAHLRLSVLGLDSVSGGEHCTFSDPERFYSYRRDGETGRMASLVLIDTPAAGPS